MEFLVSWICNGGDMSESEQACVRPPEPTRAPSNDLTEEGRVFGRYLLGKAPSAELVARYAAASRTLLPDVPLPEDASVVAFARRRPWSIGCLDGACALRRPTGTLRSKLLIMSAICEAAPGSGDEFLPRVAAVPALVAQVIIEGAMAVMQAGIGLALYPFVAGRQPRP